MPYYDTENPDVRIEQLYTRYGEDARIVVQAYCDVNPQHCQEDLRDSYAYCSANFLRWWHMVKKDEEKTLAKITTLVLRSFPPEVITGEISCYNKDETLLSVRLDKRARVTIEDIDQIAEKIWHGIKRKYFKVVQ